LIWLQVPSIFNVTFFSIGVCEMKVTDFEEARLSFGTDEDLIAVELPAPLNTAAKNFDIK